MARRKEEEAHGTLIVAIPLFRKDVLPYSKVKWI
jgi:hypothetical protein